MNAVRARAIAELRHIVLAALGEHDAAVWLFGSCAHTEVLRRWLGADRRRLTGGETGIRL